MPPRASPSRMAYAGAVTPAHSFLKVVIRAQTKPPIVPIHNHGSTVAADCDWINRCQVHAADAIAQRRRIPVLLTVPWSVILSPTTPNPANPFSLNTGLEVLISCAIAPSCYCCKLVYSIRTVASLSRAARQAVQACAEHTPGNPIH